MNLVISQMKKYRRNINLFTILKTLILITACIGLWSTQTFLRMTVPVEERAQYQSTGYLVEEIKKILNADEGKKTVLEDDIKHIQRLIDQINKDQVILNENKFGPLRNDSLIIIIQVHNRPQYLKFVINSLSKSTNIENALVIFSHDYYGEKINRLVRSIKFCKVMQIFYPYTMQTHPQEFPGQSPNDCPPNIDRNEAIRINCTNALHPDHNGHYREADQVQTKHHWWWKMNHVFDGLRVTEYFTGLIMFMEEDQYLVPDFISVLFLMERVRSSECPKCKILLLGDGSPDPLATINFQSESRQATVRQWIHGTNNLGITFNRTTWEEIRSCSEIFCRYDDYNWDWSLLPISTRCFPHPISVIIMKTPRALHFGECGMHFHGNCNSTTVLKQVMKIIKEASPYLYPDHLEVTKLMSEMTYVPALYQKNGWGGWGDLRDQELCLKHVKKIKN